MFFLLVLLRVSHKRSQLSDLLVHVLVEVESVLLPAAYLQQIVVKSLLGDADFRGCLLQRFLDESALLVVKPSVEPSPQSHLLYNLANQLLLLLGASLLVRLLLVLAFLFVQQVIDQGSLVPAHLELELSQQPLTCPYWLMALVGMFLASARAAVSPQ